MSASAAITIFTKLGRPGDPDGALLSKRITLGPDSKPSDGSPCRMATGTAITVPAPDASTLGWLIDGLHMCDALALGSISTAIDTRVNVVTAAMLARLSPAQRGNNTIARTREHIAFRPGAPAWALLDFDRKGMPANVQGQLDTVGGFWSALLSIVAGLARAAHVTRASTSAGLQHCDTGEHYPGSGGMHAYILVRDGTELDRALQALHARCWLHGLGWYLIGSAGQLLERSIVDSSVRFSERLVFEGPPDVIPPLIQDAAARACEVFEGEAIDTEVIIPDLTRDEKQAVEALKTAQRLALEPQALPIRAAADQRLVEGLIARVGMPRTAAMRQVAARHRGILMPDIELVTDHLGTVTVREILADPGRYVDETICDPMEGTAYGHDKAKIMRSQREPGRLFIHSFAHGGTTYDLRHDLRSAEALLEATSVEQLGDALCEVVDSAELEDDEVRRLLQLCAERAPTVGIRSFKKRLKDDRDRRANARRRAAAQARQAATDVDQRVRRTLPPKDGEVTPVVTDIDHVLGADDGDHPPMRRPDGALVEVRTQRPVDLHQLVARGANSECDEDDAAEPLPAPPELLLESMTPVTVNMMIEKFFVWEKFNKKGIYLYNGALGERFINSFMQLSSTSSALPAVHAVVTAPMVLDSGDVLDGIGLDRASGLYYAIEPWMRECLPQGPIDPEDVRNAVKFLCDEWLVDVLTNTRGKLTAIAACLSLIQRHLLPERPACGISAGRRGGGKTTLAHMLFASVFGRMASAASWSENQEERRKALFAYLLMGVAALVWDNIKLGTEISCPEVEKALTSPTISDRVLGVSKGALAAAAAIQFFIGNNIKFVGDLASRVVEIRLTTDTPRPEDRPVKHANPIAWTQANRSKILRAFYKILIYGCQNRPADQVAKTRFRTWWRIVGWPVELAASLLDEPAELDFTAVFKATEEQDTKAASVASALRLLRQEFGSVRRYSPPKPADWFRSRQIREILDAGERARSIRRDSEKAEIERANAFLAMIEELRGKRNRSPISKLIGDALGSIVDNPVEQDATTVRILRTRVSRGENQFHVETHTVDERPKNIDFPENGTAKAASAAHPDHHSATSHTSAARSAGGDGGQNDPGPGEPPTKNAKFPGRGDGLADRRTKRPEVEEVPGTLDSPSDTETLSREGNGAVQPSARATRRSRKTNGHVAVRRDLPVADPEEF